MDKMRVLVCGTSFGQLYIQGILKFSKCCELVGIVSRGSEQSKKLADQLMVPLYEDYESITKNICDIACVVVRSGVVGGKGTNIARSLLSKGIHVVMEQPVHLSDIVECYRLARENKCTFHIESFYPYLDAEKRFIDTALKLQKKAAPVYLEAACSIQVLYPMLDVLGRVMGGFTPFKIDKDKKVSHGIYTDIYGELKGVPWSLRIQNEIDADSPDNYFYLLHKIRLYTVSGCLELTESHGDIIWIPRYIIPRSKDNVLDPYEDRDLLKLELSETLGESKINIREMYEKLWPKTLASYLDDCCSNIANQINDSAVMQHNLNTGKLWNEVGQILEQSTPADNGGFERLTLADILEGGQ